MLLSKRRVTPSIEPFPRSSERRQRSTCCSDIITDRRAANVHVNELKDPFKHRPDHPAGESVLMTDECLVLKEETTTAVHQTAESWQCEVHFLTHTDSVWHLILFFFLQLLSWSSFDRSRISGSIRGFCGSAFRQRAKTRSPLCTSLLVVGTASAIATLHRFFLKIRMSAYSRALICES